ncbi:ATP-binding protein [Nonomuraea basaltis]|uniref:ATP-binding protein n=1 Tax=Nonomuraea basaltis TaxID=2495887 RepID=UPI00110C5949|nr:ATP-binding protein [Nonomuraea basaltis]TMR92042.1 ATP-binding protein [Nonomuraea basaltis]
MSRRFLADLVFPGVASSVPVARHCIKAILAAAGHRNVTGVQLVVSELVANALTHSVSGLPGGLITVGVRAIGDDLARIDVMDDGGVTAPHVRESGELDCSGRGLQIVDDTALRWGIGDNAFRGRRVWAEVLTTDETPVGTPDT